MKGVHIMNKVQCLTRAAAIVAVSDYILRNYHASNAKEYEVLGRALSYIQALTVNNDGSISYVTPHRRYTNETWRACALIDNAISYLREHDYDQQKL